MHDLIIHVGHEGRTRGATGATGNGLTERAQNTIVADAAVRVARQRGLNVLRLAADGLKPEQAKLAIAIHHDGNPAAGAQVLYDDVTDRPAARDFLAAYVRHLWPFKTLPDNTTPIRDPSGRFSAYYGFRYWTTTDAEFVIECGTLGDPTQAAWLKANAVTVGEFIGAWAAARIKGEPLDLDGSLEAEVAQLTEKLDLAQQTITRLSASNKTLQSKLAKIKEIANA